MKKLTEEEIKKSEASKQQIRALISNVYDMQKLRIASGNRLVQSFYYQLGLNPSESPDNLDDKSKKMLDIIKKEYNRISDGIVKSGSTLRKQIKEIQKEGTADSALQYIKSEIDYKMVDNYMLLLKSEEGSIKILDKYVKDHPLYENFFKDIKGCGTLMSAMCIAYLDPRKARYVSSFFRYCGVDTVRDEDENGNIIFTTDEDTPRKVREKVVFVLPDGSNYSGKVRRTDGFTSDGEQIWETEDGESCIMSFVKAKIDGVEVPVYETIDTGEEYIGTAYISEHGRRRSDTEEFEYTTKEGDIAIKKGLTYNPLVKTKLMGVLTGCLLKAKDPVYSEIYYEYRKRLDRERKYQGYRDAHKNMMAQRYMIKQFLRNLWVAWRELEGLEVNFPYEVAKLGNKPHKYNQYQCDVASKCGAKIDGQQMAL